MPAFFSDAAGREAGLRILPGKTGTRRVFVAGKGGVGKTTVAAATALWAAAAGCRTLLVTTDPAAHIGAVLETAVGATAAPVAGVPHLQAVNLDARAATTAYQAAVLEDAHQRFDAATVARMAEELDSPCTEEVAVFQQFLDHLLGETADVVVFDTAPTGHTLRLLEMPRTYQEQLRAKVQPSAEGAAVDRAQEARMASAFGMLRDPDRTSLALVLLPEATPVAEAGRAARELSSLGIRTGFVVVNQVLPAEVCTSPFFARRHLLQQEHLNRLPAEFPETLLLSLALQAADVRGLSALQQLGEALYGPPE